MASSNSRLRGDTDARTRGISRGGTGPTQQRHAFNVMRLREHVDRHHAVEGVPAGAEHLEVAGQRLGVTGDVGDSRGGELYQAGQRLRLATRPGRVEDHGVGLNGQLAQHVLSAPKHELDVRGARRILPGIGYRSRRLLDGQHPAHVRREEHGKGAHTGVCIKQDVRRSQCQPLPYHLSGLGRLFHVHLEEGGRGHKEPVVPDALHISLLPGCYVNFRIEKLGLNQVAVRRPSSSEPARMES